MNSSNSDLEKLCFSHIEEDLHSNFAESRVGANYIINDDLFRNIDVYCNSVCRTPSDTNTSCPFVIAGVPGSGKTSLLANWKARRKLSAPPPHNVEYDEFLFWHSIGCSRVSTQVTQLLRRLILSLTKHFELKTPIDQFEGKLSWALPHVLESASKKGCVVIILDGGLENICGKDADLGLSWIPSRLPPNVRLILSATVPQTKRIYGNSDYAAKHHRRIKKTWDSINRMKWPVIMLNNMSQRDIVNVVEMFDLSPTCANDHHNKKWSSENFESSHPQIGNPCFLTLLHRGMQVANYLGYEAYYCTKIWIPNDKTTIFDLMENIIATFESGSHKYRAHEQFPSPLGKILGHALSLLFVARHGLHEQELFESLLIVIKQSLWKDKIYGTVLPVKLKIVKVLSKKKKRLIDIFRSFDSDVSVRQSFHYILCCGFSSSIYSRNTLN